MYKNQTTNKPSTAIWFLNPRNCLMNQSITIVIARHNIWNKIEALDKSYNKSAFFMLFLHPHS